MATNAPIPACVACELALLPIKRQKLALLSLYLGLARQLALANATPANVRQDKAWKVLVHWSLPSLATANPRSTM